MVTRSDAKMNLRKVLFKLGIKSAEVTHLEEMIRSMAANFGKPDVVMMAPSALDAFMEAMYGVKKDDKQEGASDAGVTSDPVRDWFSVPAIIGNPDKK